jgi:4,5-dihydroxyphthalate decarboxylase
MSNLRLALACWNYDRTRALMEGRIRPDGIDLTYLNLPVEETFFRMLRHHEFDAAEMSLSSYVLSLFSENPPFVAIPVFPSRFFRHSCIYINRESGIREPKDLIGKRVGTPEYQMTAGVWIRGILSDEYGVPLSSVKYFNGGEEEPGRREKLQLSLPPEISLESIPESKTLSAMLDKGEIDALYTARMPSSLCADLERLPDCSRTILRWNASIIRAPRFFPSCTPWSFAGRFTRSIAGSLNLCIKRLCMRNVRFTKSSTRRLR